MWSVEGIDKIHWGFIETWVSNEKNRMNKSEKISSKDDLVPIDTAKAESQAVVVDGMIESDDSDDSEYLPESDKDVSEEYDSDLEKQEYHSHDEAESDSESDSADSSVAEVVEMVDSGKIVNVSVEEATTAIAVE